jgi:multidrug efflux pump subunit AcrA (membrane-fusion protein)
MKKGFYVLIVLLFFVSCSKADKKKEVAAEKAKLEIANNRVVGVGMIVPEKDIVQLSSPVNGIVKKILKSENDSVSIGTPILELDHQLEDAKVKQLNSEVATQAAQIKADEASVSEYDAKYENAVAELQRLQRLLAKGAETQQEVDNANTSLKSFQSNLYRLQASAEVSKSRLNETKAALHEAQIERARKIIVSPVNGRILELTVLAGGSVDTQESLAQISPEGKTIALCEIDEMYAGKIAVGQKGWIRNVGSIDTLSTGTVYFTYSFLKKKSLFTDQSGEKEDRRVRTIKMFLDQPEKLLLNARIECVIDISGNPKN